MRRPAAVALVIDRDPGGEAGRQCQFLGLWRPATAGPTSGFMLISWVDLLIAVVGLLLYVLAANPKLQEVGKLTYFAGLLATCLLLGAKTIHIP